MMDKRSIQELQMKFIEEIYKDKKKKKLLLALWFVTLLLGALAYFMVSKLGWIGVLIYSIIAYFIIIILDLFYTMVTFYAVIAAINEMFLGKNLLEMLKKRGLRA